MGPVQTLANTPQTSYSTKPTFRDVLSYAPACNNPGSSTNTTDWKTPPLKKTKHESIIKIKGQSDSRAVIQEIKTNLKSTNTTESFKRVKQLQNGSVVEEYHNEKQQKKLG